MKIKPVKNCEFEVSTMQDCVSNINKRYAISEFFNQDEIQDLINININLNKSKDISTYTKIDEPFYISIRFKWNIYFNKNIKEPAIENIIQILNDNDIDIVEENLTITQRTIKIDYELFNIMVQNND